MEKQKRYMERIKLDPEKYAKFKEKDRLRAKLKRDMKTSVQQHKNKKADLKKVRQKEKNRKRIYREKMKYLKDHPDDHALPTPYSCKQTLFKAVAKAKKKLARRFKTKKNCNS